MLQLGNRLRQRRGTGRVNGTMSCDHDDRHARQNRGHLGQHRQRRRVSPVQVIDHHQQRGVRALAQPIHHPARLLDPSTVAIATQDRELRRGDTWPRQLADQLGPRLQRRHRRRLPTRCPTNRKPALPSHHAGMFCQSSLAEARLTNQNNESPDAMLRQRQPSLDLALLTRAPDQHR